MFEGRPTRRSENPFCAPAKWQGVWMCATAPGPSCARHLVSETIPRILTTPHSHSRARSSGWSRGQVSRRGIRKKEGKPEFRDQAIATLRQYFDVIPPGETLLAWLAGRSLKNHERSNEFWYECGTFSADNFVSIEWRAPLPGGSEARIVLCRRITIPQQA